MQRKQAPRIYRVAELSRRVRLKVESWGEVWVEGELSDVSRATSGHLYFTLHDGAEPAQLRGVMFRGDARFARAKMEEGERVRVLGALSLYEPRGSFQILARLALTAGEGDKRAELARLKKKLAAEGLFAPEKKRRLPRFPSVVGLVTSREGAALHDVVRVASGRAPVRLVVSHCQVQGAEAPLSIVRAIRRICGLPGLEVVIVTRGGGASEDLSAFNDERVARAIAACPVPVVSGVGHEIDETIADLAADVRAATPSNAAELVVPDAEALRAELDTHRRRLERALEVRTGQGRLRLERFERRLADPRRTLSGVRHRLSGSRAGLERAMGRMIAARRARLNALAQRLGKLDPRAGLARDRAALVALTHRLHAIPKPLLDERRRALAALSDSLIARTLPRLTDARRSMAAFEVALRARVPPRLAASRSSLTALDAALRRGMRPRLVEARGSLGALAARLGALSPLSILARGYAIAIHEESGRALLSASEAEVGDELEVRLSDGRLRARVEGRET